MLLSSELGKSCAILEYKTIFRLSKEKHIIMGHESSKSEQRKLKLLGLHGFRTSGEILRRQLSKWNSSILDLIELDAIDAPLSAVGKSDVEGYFDGPYYEWYRYTEGYTETQYVDEAIAFITNHLKVNGPYDGLIGFSQGALLSNFLAGLQEKGLALHDVPPIRLMILISPAKGPAPHYSVYEEPAIKCPALVFLGEKDWLRPHGEELIKSFEEPLIINHRYGHTVPRLDEAQTATVTQFVRSRLATLHDSKAGPRFEGDISFSAPVQATQDTKQNEVEATYAINNADTPTEEVHATA